MLAMNGKVIEKVGHDGRLAMPSLHGEVIIVDASRRREMWGRCEATCRCQPEATCRCQPAEVEASPAKRRVKLWR